MEKAASFPSLPRESQLGFIDDPDEGLSEEEKAKIVSPYLGRIGREQGLWID